MRLKTELLENFYWNSLLEINTKLTIFQGYKEKVQIQFYLSVKLIQIYEIGRSVSGDVLATPTNSKYK